MPFEEVIDELGQPDRMMHAGSKKAFNRIEALDEADFENSRVAFDYGSENLRLWFKQGTVDTVQPLNEKSEDVSVASIAKPPSSD